MFYLPARKQGVNFYNTFCNSVIYFTGSFPGNEIIFQYIYELIVYRFVIPLNSDDHFMNHVAFLHLA